MTIQEPKKILDLDCEEASHSQEQFEQLLAKAVSKGKLVTEAGTVRRGVDPCEFEFAHRATFNGSESWTDVWRHIPSGNHLMVVKPVAGDCFLVIPANNIESMGGTFDI